MGVDIQTEKLEAVVGFSMGGQIAYHWGALYPGPFTLARSNIKLMGVLDRVKLIVCLATSARTSQRKCHSLILGPDPGLIVSADNIAFLEGPKAALIASDSYEAGSKGPAAFGQYVASHVSCNKLISVQCLLRLGF